MKHIFFEGECNDENVEKFAAALDDAESKDQPVIVYLSSPGGSEANCYLLAELTDRYPFELEIRVTWNACSAAFAWVCMTKKKVTFMPISYAAVHVASRKVDTDLLMDDESGDMFLIEQQKKRNNEWFRTIYKYLTDEERSEIKKGRLVYLTSERAQKIVDWWPK